MLGQRINNYEIVEEIGSGGMGIVYLALHPFIRRRAAVKVLHAEFVSSGDVATRFLNEALAANAIGHPNIIDILDAGRLPEDGRPYLMMEFLDGESLAARIKRERRLPIDDAVAYTRQVASALGAAHAKGIVHRDLKPENLFLVGDPRNPGRKLVKVLDFGIAKVQGADLGGSRGVHTRTGMVMGTPSYMSPEQCRGATEEIDHRTDIYALGTIAYEMVCGAPPFVAQGAADMLFLRLTQKVVPPRKKNPTVPRYFDRTIMRALAREAKDRHQSMEELYASLPALDEVMADSRGRPDVDDSSSGEVAAESSVHSSLPGDAPTEEGPRKVTTLSAVTGESATPPRLTKRRSSPLGLAAGVGLALLLGGVGIRTLGTLGKKAASSPPAAGSLVAHASARPAAGADVPPAPFAVKTPPAPTSASSLPASPLRGPERPIAGPPVASVTGQDTAPRSVPAGTASKAKLLAAKSRTPASTARIPADDATSKKAPDGIRHPRARPKAPETGDDAPIKF